MFEQMQKERDGAAAAAVRLNSAPASMYGQASTNGCSSENVGTHSLMSKDSDDKQPLRPEAVAFAKHASASVAKLLLDRVYGPAPVTEGVDWDTVLQFFVRGVPAGLGGGSWEREMLPRVHALGTFRQPSVSVIGQQPPFGLLGPTRDRARLAARRAGTRRVDLKPTTAGLNPTHDLARQACRQVAQPWPAGSRVTIATARSLVTGRRHLGCRVQVPRCWSVAGSPVRGGVWTWDGDMAGLGG